MRNLIALFACCLVVATASANDPPKPEDAAKSSMSAKAADGSSAKASADAAKPGEGAKPAEMAAKPKPGMANNNPRAQEEQAEVDLSAKIAARLATLRAAQAARAAAAVKAKKQAAIKEAADNQRAAIAAIPHGDHWSYEGDEGPANWGKLNVDWAKCGVGNRQSPIDIRDGMKVDLEPIAFDYRPSSFSVVDNGHTVQVTFSGGNYITVQNRMYELVQLHFHRPSEERINGRGYEMVVHLVHKDAEGKLAVLAVLLERGKGLEPMQTVWNNLPLEKNDTITPSILLDPSEFLPTRHDYFTYMGSLTTPPCTEGVLWLVLKQPMQASPAQMALFSRLYPLNARPIQASSGRIIKESN